MITGAATGIGALVVKFILEEGVKHVAVLDVDVSAGTALENEMNSKHGDNKVQFYECDVTNEELFLGIFKTVKDKNGYIDVVINNAGIMNDRLTVYKKEIAINVTALVTSTFKAIELMRKDKGGRGGTVINIASIVALMQSPVIPLYFATKSAVLQFSNCLGMNAYYSRTGVRILAICFGATNTPLLSAQKLGNFDPDFEDEMLKMVDAFPQQSPISAAKGLVEAFKEGKSGSTWLITNDKPAEDISGDIQKAYGIMSSKVF